LYVPPDPTIAPTDLRNREKQLSAALIESEKAIEVYFSDYCSLFFVFFCRGKVSISFINLQIIQQK
jgi:hypothetical protein